MSLDLVFPHTFVPWFRAVAPHIHAYHGKTFVVAIAGEMIAAGKLNALVQDLAILHAMGMKLVLVHGFRPQVNDQLKAKNHPARYSHGIRITDEVALDCAQEAAGQLRFEIEAAFSQGLPNTPMANATVRVVSGNFLTARPVGIVDGVDFMHSGVVRKVDGGDPPRDRHRRRRAAVAVRLLAHRRGLQPHHGRGGHVHRVALQADKLLFLTEVPGIHEDPNDPETPDRHRARAGRRRAPGRQPAAPQTTRSTPRSTCSTASRPARAASSARTSCRSRSTARC
jgi:amino-acid N-acetyltransferase